MYFGLSEEQELLQETVRSFAAGECPPDRMRQLFDDGRGHSPELWKGLAEIGISGLAVDEQYGGAGMDWLDLALVAEEIGASSLPVPLVGHALACFAIEHGGSAEQKERWLPPLASGERIGAVALAEGPDHWEPEDWKLELADGGLRGRKRYATDPDEASLFVVGTAGGGLAVVEREATGVKVESINTVDHSRQVGDLVFDGAPAEALDGGIELARRTRDAGLVLLTADAFGAAERLLRTTIEYAKTRQQFGQEIAQFQAVKHELAEMATQIESSRGLWWYAGHVFDHMQNDSMRSAALAKAHITDMAAKVARSAVELHGGLGFTWECDVHIHMKRIMFDRSYLGTPEHQRRRIAVQEGW